MSMALPGNSPTETGSKALMSVKLKDITHVLARRGSGVCKPALRFRKKLRPYEHSQLLCQEFEVKRAEPTWVDLLAGASVEDCDALLLRHFLACIGHAIPTTHLLRVGWAHICMKKSPVTIE